MCCKCIEWVVSWMMLKFSMIIVRVRFKMKHNLRQRCGISLVVKWPWKVVWDWWVSYLEKGVYKWLRMVLGGWALVNTKRLNQDSARVCYMKLCWLIYESETMIWKEGDGWGRALIIWGMKELESFFGKGMYEVKIETILRWYGYIK